MGFQIAPMIDVVFVILLYFMVAAGSSKKDSALHSRLPGAVIEEPTLVTPDVLEIKIDEVGQVSLNDEILDSPTDKKLPELTLALRDLKQAGPQNEFLISTDELTKYQRVVDVLDVLSREKITNVTFKSGGSDW